MGFKLVDTLSLIYYIVLSGLVLAAIFLVGQSEDGARHSSNTVIYTADASANIDGVVIKGDSVPAYLRGLYRIQDIYIVYEDLPDTETELKYNIDGIAGKMTLKTFISSEYSDIYYQNLDKSGDYSVSINNRTVSLNAR